MTSATPGRTVGRAGTAVRALDVLRWQVGYGIFGAPQAAAPILFAFVVLPLTGREESGAWLVLTMTAAQIMGAVPISRLGQRFDGTRYLRSLIVIRALALTVVVVMTALAAPFWTFVAAVFVAGIVNGAAYGYQRFLLSHLVDPQQLPRALGVAATLNEVTFALAPVLAALVGAVSPVLAMGIVAALSYLPACLIPAVQPDTARQRPVSRTRKDARPRMPKAVWVWLFCAGSGGAAVAAIEVGAVALAVSYGLDAGWAFIFAAALCAGSILGGVWVSVRNAHPAPITVILYLVATLAGSTLVAVGGTLPLTLAGAFAVGVFLPMLGTFYSLAVDALAPASRRPEMFALLRTSASLGIIFVSALLATSGLGAALLGAIVLLALAVTGATVLATGGRAVRPADTP